MGNHKAMTWLNTIILFVVTVLAVYWEAAFGGVRRLFGAQVDLLPPLIVYASLYGSLRTVTMVAMVGGLLFDSLSANPLGITVLPLFLCGLAIHSGRELILRDQTFAQAVLGYGVSLVTPIMILVMLLTTRHEPLFGWGTIWQIMVMSIGGAIATPIIFELFGLLNRLFGHAASGPSSFRPDREIRRGRM
jgi:rod shape-determining protein MreD